MLSSIDRMRHAQIWDLLDQYADIRDHLEDILYSMQMLQSQLTSDLEDLSDDFGDLTEELSKCSKNLIRFKTVPDPPLRDDQACPAATQQLPFPNENDPFPFFPDEEDTQLFPWDCTEEERR